MTKRRIADRNDPDMTTSPDRYISTRGDAAPTRFSDALLRGIAPDGGLYMPQAWPSLPADATRPGRGYAEIAKAAMAPFIGDALPAGALDRALERLTKGFDHPLVTPLVELEPGLFVLELFHGPTAAFKDLAMQLVAALSDEALAATGETLTLLTATVAGAGARGLSAWIAFLGGLAVIGLSMWVGVRLSLLSPQTFAEGRINVRESWVLTHGHFWGLLGMFVLNLLMALGATMAMSLVGGVLTGLIALIGGGSKLFVILGLLVNLLIAPLIVTVQTVILTAGPARAYRQLHPDI